MTPEQIVAAGTFVVAATGMVTAIGALYVAIRKDKAVFKPCEGNPSLPCARVLL